MQSSVLCKGKEAPYATHDTRINHRFYSSAVRGFIDLSNVADSHWVMLHYLAKNPQGQNVI